MYAALRGFDLAMLAQWSDTRWCCFVIKHAPDRRSLQSRNWMWVRRNPDGTVGLRELERSIAAADPQAWCEMVDALPTARFAWDPPEEEK